MNDKPLTPLFILAVSLAYVIQADETTTVQERAEWVTVFGKLVESGGFSKSQLETMTKKAFAEAADTELSSFLEAAVPLLSYSQKLAVLLNLYDSMLVDGVIKEGERVVFTEFQRAFNIDEKTARDIREFLMLKNDISLFTDPSHPFNDDDFTLGHLFRDASGGGP